MKSKIAVTTNITCVGRDTSVRCMFVVTATNMLLTPDLNLQLIRGYTDRQTMTTHHKIGGETPATSPM